MDRLEVRMDALGLGVEQKVFVGDRSRHFLTTALSDRSFRNQLVRRVKTTSSPGVDHENIVHEVFLKLWLQSPVLNDENHAYHYVRRAVRNYCIDMARAAKVRLEESLSGTDHEDTVSLFKTVLKGELLSKLRMALAPMDQIVLDRCVNGESPKEIAEVIGITQKAVYDSRYRIIRTGIQIFKMDTRRTTDNGEQF
jgi:RNA polymerase sigma factor (sigma-70 family)